MRETICRRLRDDGGVSLVEMLIALVLLSVGLMALLSTLIASAHSLSSQRSTAAANRVASAEFERVRATDYDDPALDAGTVGPYTVTLDGRDYTVERTIAELDADPGGTLSSDTIKRVELDVSWSDGATARSRTFSTALAPPSRVATVTPSGSIGDLVADPATAWVDPDTGHNAQAITLTVPLIDVPPGTVVTLEWEDDNGSHLRTTTYMSGTGVTFVLQPGDVTRVIPAEDNQAPLDLSVFVQSASKGHTVTLQREPDEPLTLYSPSVSPAVIWVERPTGNNTCDGNNQCENVAAVTFRVDVDGFDTSMDVDTVRVRFAVHGGNYEEVSLVRTHVIDATRSRWAVTLPKNAVKFDAPFTPGAVAHRTFTFIAIRTADTPPTEVYLSFTHPVGRQP